MKLHRILAGTMAVAGIAAALLSSGCGKEWTYQVKCAVDEHKAVSTLVFPKEFCACGTSLSYEETRDDAGKLVESHYVLSRGYLAEASPETLMMSEDGINLSRLYVEDFATGKMQEVTPQSDPAQWTRNQDMLELLIEEYQYDMVVAGTKCEADRMMTSESGSKYDMF
jgi:hypothetical protein